ncbi:acyltransferase [Alicyclobacillaceae bacterium I2511]|nr:acyltransferase [Alicyclobacillaceae bacterium I2511]
MGIPIIVEPHAVYGPGKITYGENVFIAEHSWFSLPRPEAEIIIGSNTQLGRFFGMSCAYRIEIGDSCLIGERVFIADVGHAYENPDCCILVSGLTGPSHVTIGNDVLIGVGAFVGPGVTIGQHVMIGANAVVTHDVPSYSVAAGNPARVVKRFDFASSTWVSVPS